MSIQNGRSTTEINIRSLIKNLWEDKRLILLEMGGRIIDHCYFPAEFNDETFEVEVRKEAIVFRLHKKLSDKVEIWSATEEPIRGGQNN